MRPSVMRSSLALQRRPSFRANCVAPRRALPVVRASADREQKAEEEQATAAATTLLAAAGLLAPFLLDTESAMAVPEILKGRTASLIHPGEHSGRCRKCGVACCHCRMQAPAAAAAHLGRSRS